MDITVHLTANHLGFFEFRLCPNNNPKSRVKQECLDKFLLERADGEGTKFQVPKGKYNAMFNYTLKLPRGLTCHQCVIQWKYRTGNTWDKEIDSGRFCLGCGPQEEFYNCADIAIEPRRPAVIEYPTSQPDPPQFLPTINLPTVATIKPTQRTSRSIFTKTPEKNRHTTKYKKPPVRLPTMPLPPMPPGIPPPPRLPHSKTRPVNKKRPKPQEMTSIFTTPTPRRLKTYRPKKTLPTTPIRTVRRSRKTTRRKTTTSTRATTTTSKPTTTTATTTTATTTTTAKTTIPTTTTTTTPKTTSVKTTTRTTTTPRKTTRRRTKRTKPTTTASPPTQRRRVTKLVRTTKKPLIRSRPTTPSNPKKTTHYYKIVQRRTWGPPTRRQPSRATSPKTTKQTVKKQQKKPSKTKETPKSPFQRPTTVRYKYWKPRVSKYPLLKDNLELEDIKEVETVTKSTRRARKPSTKRPKITTSKPTTRKTTTTTATTTPRKTTPTTTKRYKKTTPPKTTTATTTKESTRTTALVKWWTNKPDTTTKYRRRPTTTIAFTRPTRTQHKWSTPSFWWPPIWLPWTPWAKRTRRVDSTPTTTTQRTTTTTRQTTTKAQTTTSQVPRTYPTTHFINVKEGGEIVRILDNTIEKVSSNEALPWYIGGDLGWKSASPPGGDETRLYDRISKNPQTKTKTSEEPSGPTTLLPCLQSTTPKPEHRDNLVKSPFLLPKNDKRKTPALKPTQKTPPVWLRTVIPPVVQPVQPPPPSHHLWVKKNVKRCRAIIPLAVGMNDWCFVNCNSGFCPRKFCYCENKYKRPRYRHFTKKPPLWWKESLRKPSRSSRPRLQQRQRAEASRRERVSDRQTALQNIKQNMYRCRGVGKYSDRPEFDDWCQTNCRTVLCPLLICGCTWR